MGFIDESNELAFLSKIGKGKNNPSVGLANSITGTAIFFIFENSFKNL